MNEQTEDATIERAARGDEHAFGLLLERYKAMVYTTASRLLRDSAAAEDAAQDTFIKAWAALPGFQRKSKFSSWLYRICYNTCISQIRKRKPDADLDLAAGVSTPGPVATVERRNIQSTLEQEIMQLPDDYRALVTLYHLDGMAYEEIARLLHLPMGTVKANLHRARALLRTRLVERVGWDNLREVMWH